MCGICGIVAASPPADGLVERMTDLMLHRGPDEAGFHKRGGVQFGMRRLGIIDLEGGHQPVRNEDGTVWAVCNGEIYNHVELRDGLCRRGHRFATASDVEVLVHLWEEKGAGLLEDLNGMFAFALHDTGTGEVLLARDRIGKKPLFLAEGPGGLAFASDIKPLLALPGARRELDLGALNQLLRHNYVPAPATLFAGIRELEPATALLLGPAGRREVRYWSPPSRWTPGAVGLEEAAAQARQLLSDSVRLRLRSDVPVGIFLSGGIDSSLVAAECAGQGARPDAFCAAFPGSRFDEEPHARAAAEALGFAFHRVPLQEGDLEAAYRDLLWFLEEPHGDASFLPTYRLSQEAARTVRVVLTGDGADEAFAGYERHRAAWRRAHEVPPAQALAEAVLQAFACTDAQRRSLLLPSAWRDLPDPAQGLPAAATPDEALHALMRRDVEHLLPGNNVVKPDKMGMACSLEARCPFLDYRLVELGLALPPALHLQGGATKAVLRRALAGTGLAALAERPKQQFTVPMSEWLRADPGGRLAAVILRLGTRGLFDAGEIRRLLEEHRAGGADHGRVLRLLFVLEVWMERFLDRDPLAEAPPRMVPA